MVKGTPFYASYLAPILLITTCNLVALFMVFRSLSQRAKLQKSIGIEMAVKVRMAAALSVVMGTTWIVGLFAVGKLTLSFQVIFCIFNSLQGFFIFIFYCARVKDVREEWKRCFKGWKKRFTRRKTEKTGLSYSRKKYSLGESITGTTNLSFSGKRESIAFAYDNYLSLSTYRPPSESTLPRSPKETESNKFPLEAEKEETDFRGTTAATEKKSFTFRTRKTGLSWEYSKKKYSVEEAVPDISNRLVSTKRESFAFPSDNSVSSYSSYRPPPESTLPHSSEKKESNKSPTVSMEGN